MPPEGFPEFFPPTSWQEGHDKTAGCERGFLMAEEEVRWIRDLFIFTKVACGGHVFHICKIHRQAKHQKTHLWRSQTPFNLTAFLPKGEHLTPNQNSLRAAWGCTVSLTLLVPFPRKKMAFILGRRSSRRPCQAWPASWQKCRLLTKTHTRCDAVPENSLKSGFEDNPREDKANGARRSFLKFTLTVLAFLCFRSCNFQPRFEHDCVLCWLTVHSYITKRTHTCKHGKLDGADIGKEVLI